MSLLQLEVEAAIVARQARVGLELRRHPDPGATDRAHQGPSPLVSNTFVSSF